MKNKPNVFFILFIDFFCYEGKHQGIQQNLTYPTEEKQNTEKRKEKGNQTGQRDDSKPRFIFSRQKYKLLNTEMYNKATKTNGFHDHFVKEGNSPQSKEREKKTQKENNADILKRISFLKFLFF